MDNNKPHAPAAQQDYEEPKRHGEKLDSVVKGVTGEQRPNAEKEEDEKDRSKKT